MENTNKITVKAEYTVPKTTEIDALLNQLAIAKQITATTKEELTPLIMAEGKAKYDAIMEQLNPIIVSMIEFSQLKNDVVSVTGFYKTSTECERRRFKIETHYKWTHSDITFSFGKDFDWNRYSSILCVEDGLLTNWNQYQIIDQLKSSLNKQIQNLIKTEMHKTETIKNNYAIMHS